MRYLWGLVVAGGILVGQPGAAEAQFSLSIGNPYLGSGYAIGNPGYGYGYNSFSSYGYGNGIYGAPLIGAPVVGAPYGYSSGYAGFAPVVRPAAPYYGGYRGGYYGGYRGRPYGYGPGYYGRGYGYHH